MITHTVEDANTGIKYSIFLTLDKHGLVIRLSDGQIIVLDCKDQTFSLYHYENDQTDNEFKIQDIPLHL